MVWARPQPHIANGPKQGQVVLGVQLNQLFVAFSSPPPPPIKREVDGGVGVHGVGRGGGGEA